MRFNEIVENAALFTPPDEFGGIWVKPDGSHVECEYEKKLHHPATFAAHHGEEYHDGNEDYQHFMERGFEAGWVRVAKHGRTFLVEFDHARVSKLAVREVTRLLRESTMANRWEFNILNWEDEFECFNELKDATRFWNRYREDRRRGRLDEKVEIEREHESMLTASLNGKPVAWYIIDQRRPGEVSLHSNVDAAARRQGISMAVYDWAEKYFAEQGLRLVPYERLSTGAYRMWQKRDPKSVEGYRQDIGLNWYSPEAAKDFPADHFDPALIAKSKQMVGDD